MSNYSPYKDISLKIIRALKNPLNLSTLIWILFLLSLITISKSFWFWNIFSVLPAILFIPINIALQILWLRRLKKFNRSVFILIINVLLFLTLLITLYLAEFNISAFKKREMTLENTISLFNWNTEFWHSESENEEFYQFLHEQQADIYHLQERILVSESFDIDNPDDLELLLEEFKDYEIIRSGELVTLTKFPVAYVYKPNAKFLRVDMEIGSQIVSFYNVHIPVHVNLTLRDPFEFIADIKERFDWREDEFEQLLIDVKSNLNPIVISGDFNTTKSMNKMYKFKGFRDSQKVSNNLFPTTWNVFGLKLWRIDYILGNQDIKFLKHSDINPQNLSDHWGQKILLKIED